MFNLLKSFDKLKVQYARNCGAKRAYCLHFRNSSRRMKLHALSYDAMRKIGNGLYFHESVGDYSIDD